MNNKNLKEITYSSEYVEELEKKIESLNEENAELKRSKYILEDSAYYQIKTHREALRLAIINGRIIGGCDFWEKVTAAYDEKEIYDKFAEGNMSDLDEVVMKFYFFLAARKQTKDLMNCMDLNYYIFHKKSCFDIECYDCPLEKVESVIKWLKEEQYEIR